MDRVKVNFLGIYAARDKLRNAVLYVYFFLFDLFSIDYPFDIIPEKK